MLQETTKTLLQNSKNLLAFSAGGDSTALLFLLLENKIPFDIAIVNYGLREQSKEEVAYAKQLAEEYNFVCHVKNAPKIEKNFEAEARSLRYSFFEELIDHNGYENLLTAHHLGDRFEWFLMQFCKGAGCVELSGMKNVEERKNYTLVRPLLDLEKQELLEYLNDRKIKYFEDESNSDERYTRNYFRHNFSQPLLEKYLGGIKKSFSYIDQDVASLIKDVKLDSINQLAYFQTNDKRTNLVYIDRYLKGQGHLITANDKKELLENESVVIGRKYIVVQDERYVFIAPYLEAKDMDKQLKEKFRLLKVPVKLRGYLAADAEALELVSLLLQ
ncbi:tRNA lysidine(34) synthetase TilS [Sulfurimonas sp. C5]|uniref:tRNA lysidine(34) synthetase TilS n=1 Tax=Sulfurimonas sp. C5 TaxID=3036947 RepID=UPI0024570FC2|nr:tRNA lysidine(34) synthetase TilS [Sulfurimonas sp. C5]MDH4945206.1 tRNA lysidine(34) synthetase TilS [Sulfurimonas sp. C5]